MRTRASVTHLTKSTPQTPPVKAASMTKSKKQPAPAAQPSGPAATDNEENE